MIQFADLARPETIAILIPIVMIVGGVLIALVAIFLDSKKKELVHKERLVAMEKGMEIPQPPKEPERPAYLKNRSSGLVMTFLGLALTIAIWVPAGPVGGIWGLIPQAIGVGLLISSALERKEVLEKENRGRAGQP
ncbi:MAG: DUF6249 domain-containing protein [bacterium]